MSRSPGTDPVPVFVYFDYSCPFSYLACALLDAVSSATPLRIVWRPLEAWPGGDSGERAGLEEYDWEALAESAAEVGVPLYRPARRPLTRLALQAGEFAYDLGEEAHQRLHRAIFRAHFVRGLDIERPEHLLQIAVEEGLDREAFELALEDGRYQEELTRSEVEAERYGIAQTPTMLFGRFKVVGAAPPDVLEEAARRASEEATARP